MPQKATELTWDWLQSACAGFEPEGSGGGKNNNLTITVTTSLLIGGEYLVSAGTKLTFFRNPDEKGSGKAICTFYCYDTGQQITVYKDTDNTMRYSYRRIGNIDPSAASLSLLPHRGSFR